MVDVYEIFNREITIIRKFDEYLKNKIIQSYIDYHTRADDILFTKEEHVLFLQLFADEKK